MKFSLLSSIGKGFFIGIGIAAGLITATVIAVTVSYTFEDGDPLTAEGLNSLRDALVSLPAWKTGISGQDATFNTGKVGIGTESPRTALDINGSMAFAIKSLPSGNTPNVSGSNVFQIDVSGDVVLADFTGGKSGQEITIIIDDDGSPNSVSFNDMNDDPTSKLKTLYNQNLVTNSGDCMEINVIKFINMGSYWQETSRSRHEDSPCM